MKPDEPKNSQGGKSLSQQEAATNIIRSQIDQLFDNQNGNEPKQAETSNPYERTHTEEVTTQTKDWRQYHTAWQSYYQQYYEGYYKHHLGKTDQSGANHGSHNYFSGQPEPETTVSTGDAISGIKQELIGKVQSSATKIRKSRHFIPIISGVIVVLFFLFLQYNSFLIGNVMAYVSPGNIDPQNIVIDPNADIAVGPDPLLIIPKINVEVPVYYDIGNDYNSQMAAMAKGVAQFAIPGASSHPGQIGNTVIAGHSSNDWLDGGDYKFIFAQLDKLEVGDTVYVNYQSKRYTYTVTGKEVVKPTDVSKLVYPTTKPILTLLTCTPLGTALNRLLVTAEQVSPDPNQSAPAPSTSGSTTNSIPGSSPTFFEKLFGAK